MRGYTARSWTAPAVAAVVFVGCLGCTSTKVQEGTPNEPEAEHIGKVGEWAGEYAKAHNHQAPTSIGELKTWAKKNKGATDADFESTRDHKEYALKVVGAGPSAHAMIYEQEGKDIGGTRMVYRVDQGASTGIPGDQRIVEMMGQGGPPGRGRMPPGGGGGPGGGRPGGPRNP